MDERRQLAAIMFTDIVGYTALMAESESEALSLLEKFRKTLKRDIARCGGEWLETAGDGVLASFTSAVSAVNCALLIQQQLADEKRLRIRIGIHVGDVIYTGGQVFGDGVNIASRIEALAGPGQIGVSREVAESVRNKPGVITEPLGQKQLRNVDRPVDVYLLSGDLIETPDLSGLGGIRQGIGSRRLGIALLAIAVLAVFAILFYPTQEGARASLQSVAVLPFRNLSEDTANEYFSDGLTEELLDTLTRVEGLQVASRTSSFSFKNRDADAQEIADTLRVASLLGGSVRKQGERVRITAELVDGSSGMRLWSQTYDRELDDIFLIQTDIAREIAGNLQVVLGPDTEALISRTPTENIRAYDFYLQGLAYLHRPPTQDALDRAEFLLKEAIGVDSSFAKAYAALCEVHLARFELSNAPRHYQEAAENCNVALDLDDTLVEVRTTLGNLYRLSGDLNSAELEYLGVLEELPSSTPAMIGLADAYSRQNRYVEAEAMLRGAIRWQPGSWNTHMAMGEFLYWRLRYEEAAQEFNRVLELSPNNARALEWVGSIQINRGNFVAAEDTLSRSLELAPSRSVWRDLGLLYMYQDNFADAIVAFQQAIELEPEDHWSWGELADAYYYSDRSDEAVDAYRRAGELATALLDTDPNDWQTMSRLAIYEQRLGQRERAVDIMREAREGGSSLPLVLFHSAVLAMIIGDQITMFDDLRTAVGQGYPASLVRGNPVFWDLHGNPVFESLLDTGGGS